MEDKLLKRYIELFGDEPPLPPEHIMRSLVKMKEDGTFEQKMSVFKTTVGKKAIKDIEEKSGEPMSLNHPIFDIDFDKKPES